MTNSSAQIKQQKNYDKFTSANKMAKNLRLKVL